MNYWVRFGLAVCNPPSRPVEQVYQTSGDSSEVKSASFGIPSLQSRPDHGQHGGDDRLRKIGQRVPNLGTVGRQSYPIVG
jgi:hypothetical protein